MNIGFITDTNILKKSNEELNRDSKFFNNANFFIEYVESLEKTSNQDKLIYFMPNIIIEELYYHKLRAFKIRYEALCKSYQDISYGLVGELPVCNIEDFLNKEREEYTNRIKILELKYNKTIFKELTEDALKKNPPFDKTEEGKKADSGYKDALIWKTLIYSKEIDECEKVYFFSADKIFKQSEEYLINEFNAHHPNTVLEILFFEPDGNKRQNCLQTMIKENNLIETEIIKLYNLDLILDHIKSIKYQYDEEVYYYCDGEKRVLVDVIFKEFLKENFEIESVKEKEGKYEVCVSFSTDKYKVDNVEPINKRILNGEIKFVFLKIKNDFKLENYELLKIKFQSTISEAFSNISKMVIELCNERFAEAIQNMMINMVGPLKNIKIEAPLTKMIDSLNAIKPTFDELNISPMYKLKLEECNEKRELKEESDEENNQEEVKNGEEKKEE